MGKLLIGKVAFTPQGQYVPGRSYAKLDVVSDGVRSYYSLTDNNEAPLTNNEAWMPFVYASGILDVSVFKSEEGVPKTYDGFDDAIADVPSTAFEGGMSIRFIRQLYTVVRETSDTQPQEGTQLNSDNGIENGSKYLASELTAFAELPTETEAVLTYYIQVGDGHYTILTISKNEVADCEYLQYRYILSEKGENDIDFKEASNWKQQEDVDFLNNKEWLYVVTDSNGRFLYGIKSDGSIEWSRGVPTPVRQALEEMNEFEHVENDEYLFAISSNDNKRLFGIKRDGRVDIPGFGNMKLLEEKIDRIEDELDNSSKISVTSFVSQSSGLEAATSGVTFPSADVTPAGSDAVIEVTSQSDFENLQDNILSIVGNLGANDSVNIVVKFAPGTYYYNDGHVTLKSTIGNDTYSFENVSLSLVGNGATLIGYGKKYTIDDDGAELLADYWKVPYNEVRITVNDVTIEIPPFPDQYGMIDQDNNVVDIINQNPFEYASSGVEDVEGGELQRIEVTGLSDVSHANIGYTLVMITSAWEAFVAEVYSIETDGNHQYIYFSSSQYADYVTGDNRKRENIRIANGYGTNPRYKLINEKKKGHIFVQAEEVNGETKYFLHVPYNYTSLYDSRSSVFLNVENVSPKNVSVEGFKFLSNGIPYGKDSSNVGVILLDGENSPINESISWDSNSKQFTITPAPGRYVSICNNIFVGLKSCAVLARKAGNVYLANNSFYYNYSRLTYINTWCSNIIIESNKSNKQGLGFRQYEAFNVTGDKFLVRNNEIVDSVYSAINTGLWWTPNEDYDASTRQFGSNNGIIERNVIHNTSDFNKEPSQNALMDGAPIYLRTLNDETIVRYNIIYDIEPYRMRYTGLYVDGGGHNYKLYQNIVLGGFEKSLYQHWWGQRNGMHSSLYNRINRGNIWLYNIVDKPIDVQGCKNEEGENITSIKGENFILYISEKPSSDSAYMKTEDDAYVRKICTEGSIIYVPQGLKGDFDTALINYIQNHIYKGY